MSILTEFRPNNHPVVDERVAVAVRPCSDGLGHSTGCSQVIQIGRHLLDLSVVMVLDLLDESGILRENEVDSSSFSTETTSSTDSVNVVLLLDGELVVDNETNLLDINTSSEQVGGDKNTDGSLSELLHDDVSLNLVHLSVHDGDSEFFFSHSLLEFLDSLFGVTVNESLVDIQVSVKVEEHIHLPLFLLDSDVVLSDTFKSKVFRLNKNLCGVSHEMLGKLEDVLGKGSREKGDLDISGKVLENVLNLLLETSREHLIGFIEDEKLEVVSLHETSLHHVHNSSGGSNNDVDSSLENSNVFADNGSSNTGVDLDVGEFTNRVNDVSNLHRKLTGGCDNKGLAVVGSSVNRLEDTDSECTSLTSSGLSLSNSVLALNERQDSFHLDRRRVFVTISVNTTKDLFS